MNIKRYLTPSNIIFGIVLFLMLYKPTRIWFIRQVSFSPSVEKVEGGARVFDYNWELKGINTSDVNFSEFKGKVIFLNFWATWCPPCIAELPSIQNFYNDFNKEVAFVFVTNENWKEINSFFKKENYQFPVYQSKTSYLEELPSVKSIPRTFVIDKQGNIRVDKSGAANWNSTSFRKEIENMLQE